MDIWLSRCNKGCKCSYCGERIEVAEPEVFGKLWMQFRKEGSEVRRWVKKFHWHAKRLKDGQCCWLEQGLSELSKHPHVETRGRRTLLLPKDARASRLKILQRRAKIMQLLKVEMEKSPDIRNLEVFIRYGGELEDLRGKILQLGGVPKSWG